MIANLGNILGKQALRHHFCSLLRLGLAGQSSPLKGLQMGSMFFLPWLGDAYLTGGILPKRTLVLGESYYESDGQLNQESTRDFVKWTIGGKWRRRFFTGAAIAFLNRYPTPDEKTRFWHAVLHYTFVQKPVGQKPRDRPSRELWSEGSGPFVEVLETYRPEFVLVLGKELWNHLPVAVAGPRVEGAELNETRKYPTGRGYFALAYGIKHPTSFGFNGRNWHSFIFQAMQFAERYPVS